MALLWDTRLVFSPPSLGCRCQCKLQLWAWAARHRSTSCGSRRAVRDRGPAPAADERGKRGVPKCGRESASDGLKARPRKGKGGPGVDALRLWGTLELTSKVPVQAWDVLILPELSGASRGFEDCCLGSNPATACPSKYPPPSPLSRPRAPSSSGSRLTSCPFLYPLPPLFTLQLPTFHHGRLEIASGAHRRLQYVLRFRVCSCHANLGVAFSSCLPEVHARFVWPVFVSISDASLPLMDAF